MQLIKQLISLFTKTDKSSHTQIDELGDSDHNYEKANSISKEATKLKKSDINKAIEYLEEARKIDPNNEEIAFKLARYYRINKRNDDSFAIYRNLVIRHSSPIQLFSCAGLSKTHEQMCIQLYDEKKFSTYLYYYLFKNWYSLISLALSGRFTDSDFKFNIDIFFNSEQDTKLNKCLKELKIDCNSGKIKNEIFKIIKEHLPLFEKISKIAQQAHFHPKERSVIEELNKNDSFMASYRSLFNPLIPDTIYKKVIQPLLNQTN
jgi:tetratricopeptide (TPR) repeat protein